MSFVREKLSVSKIVFLAVGDLHLADNPPGSRVDPYRETTLGKVVMVSEIAQKLNAVGVLFTGDIFHLDRASRNSHNLVRSLIEVLNRFTCPCFCAPGNHDLKNDRLDSLPHQPLGVVFESGVMKQLTPEGFLLASPPPEEFTVRVAATSYDEVAPLARCWEVKKGGADYLLTVGHFYATMKGGGYYGKACPSYSEMAPTPTDLFVLGHFHDDRGIQRVGDKFFVGPGSLTRGILDSDSLTRAVKIVVIELTRENGVVSPSFKAVRLPVAPANEVFDLVKHAQIREEKKRMDAFVQNLHEQFSQGEYDFEDLDPLVLMKKMSLEDRVLREIQRRIAEAE